MYDEYFEKWLEEVRERNTKNDAKNYKECECGMGNEAAPKQHSKWCPKFDTSSAFDTDSCRSGGPCTDCSYPCKTRDPKFLKEKEGKED